MPAHPPQLKRYRLPSSSQSEGRHTHHRHRFTRQRPEYCDCGNPAIIVLNVRVGFDPQYTIRMPLCLACLKLEQDLD